MHLPANCPKHLIVAAAIAGAAAVIPVAALAATTAQAPAARTPSCATSGLVLWLSTPPGNGYAGGVVYDLNFTNLSGHTCTLRGYPGVSAVSLAGRRLGGPAGWGGFSNPNLRTIRLADGATATAVMDLSFAVTGGAGPCHPVTAAGLRVYPPSQFASKVIPFPFSACSHAGPSYMSVQRVQKGQ